MNNEEPKTTEMKQTAVEWLVEKLKENGVSFWQEEIEMIEEAKEMEKERLKEAYSMGRMGKSIKEFNETFKSE
jgi:hypothetical protein